MAASGDIGRGAKILDAAVGAAADENNVDRQTLDRLARGKGHIVEHLDDLFALRSVGLRHRIGHQAFDSGRSEEHTSELQSLMRISYAVFCLKKKTKTKKSQ